MKTRSYTMKRAWKYLFGFMCLVLIILLTPIPVSPASPITTITVNGFVLECDTPPFIESGTIMVPLKSISQALGVKVKWEGDTQTIIGVKNNLFIMMWIGNKMATITQLLPPHGIENVTLDMAPRLVKGTAFVPARFVSETFGVDVAWDGAATLTIKSKGAGKRYYVATDGNDSNPGTISKPWKTLGKAVISAEAGNTIYVRGGTYKERLVIERSGAVGAPITFMAYPGEEVTLDGDGMKIPDNWGGLIEMWRESAFIRISGFRVINSTDKAIFIHESSDIQIDNNYTYNTKSSGISYVNVKNLICDSNEVEQAALGGVGYWNGIHVWKCENVQVSNNYVHDSRIEGIGFSDNVNGKVFSNTVHDTELGIYICAWEGHLSDIAVYDNIVYDNIDGICVNSESTGTTERIKVYRNHVYHNDNRGIAVGWGGYPDTPVPVRDVAFYGNVSSGNGGEGFVIYGREKSAIENIQIHNNLIYDNKGHGVKITGIVKYPDAYSIRNISIINNTIHNNGSEEVWASGGIHIGPQENANGLIENITIRNNIVSGNYSYSISIWPWGTAPTGVAIDHNLIDGYRDAVHEYGETYGENAVKSSPAFKDASKGDFHLLKGSAAIDKGSPENAPAEDFDGAIRPQRNGYDIGAFEYKP